MGMENTQEIQNSRHVDHENLVEKGLMRCQKYTTADVPKSTLRLIRQKMENRDTFLQEQHFFNKWLILPHFSRVKLVSAIQDDQTIVAASHGVTKPETWASKRHCSD